MIRNIKRGQNPSRGEAIMLDPSQRISVESLAMRFGIFTGTTKGLSWEEVRSLWIRLEKTGWDAAYLADHFMPNTPDPVADTLESWTTLAGLAVSTQKIRLGHLVSGNTYRHPAILAKMAANLDIISEGRLICGIGAGWQENEHRAYGLPFYTAGERLRRLEEACQILLSLWTQPKTTFEGKYHRLKDAPLFPKPLQKPHPELLVGGGGEKVTLKIVARYADLWNGWGGAEIMTKKIRILEEHCAAVGRDPAEISRSANMTLLFTEDEGEIRELVKSFMKRFGTDEETARRSILTGGVTKVQDTVGRLREAGIDQLIVPSFMPLPISLPSWNFDQLDRFISEVAPAFR